MPFVSSRGAAIHYEKNGEGPAIVFAHGAGGNTLSWWQQVPHFVSRGYRVLCIDHRGFGRSRCPTDALHPRFFAGDLEEILNAERIERTAIVCQSMGGSTGLPFALAHPGRVSALVLCGTPAGIHTERIVREWEEVPGKQRDRGMLGMTLGLGFPERDPFRAFLYACIQGLNPDGSTAAIEGGMEETTIDAANLLGFSIPTLVLAGEEDAFFSPVALGEVAGTIPGAEFRVLAGVGHSPYFESPARFNEIVEGFLRRSGWAPARAEGAGT